MFTGIIESLGIVKKITKKTNSILLNVESDISNDLKVNQSLSHNGVCLTIINVIKNSHEVIMVDETIKKSIFKSISIGDIINLERSLLINSRLDGHIVQGHVDEMINCIEILENKDDWVFTFQFSKENKKLIVEKGSVTINGVSLTCYNVRENQFSVSIIPHTFKKTNFQLMNMGYNYNIEYDILGKYINKLISKDSIK
tara:strand:+ start:3363 stop:3959 length:597 start_codon:yes stop_codon:yes gene_type:complete